MWAARPTSSTSSGTRSVPAGAVSIARAPSRISFEGNTMNRAATLFFVIITASAAFAADPGDPVREAANGWTQAAVKQDAAGLKRYMADDLQYAHAGGQTQTKEQYIAAVTT